MKHITGDLPEKIGVYSLRCSSGEYNGRINSMKKAPEKFRCFSLSQGFQYLEQVLQLLG